MSAHLKIHPLTGTTDHSLTGLTAGQILYVQDLNNNGVQSTGLYSNGSGGLTATTLSSTTISGGTLYSGSTDLYNIFAPLGSGVQTVTAGSNIVVGGTVNNPTVSLASSPSVNNLTVSGTGNFTGTLQSGGTDLGNIFVDGSGTANTIPLWSGAKKLTNSIITQSGTGVTVNGSVNIIGNVNVIGTATTFNTQTVQSQDNNILLNFSGSYVTALGGGITVLSGTPSGAASTWSIDANGAWSANTGILTSAVTVNGGNIAVTGGGAITSGGTNLYQIFATANSGINTASNGLTKIGNDVTLGGTLNGTTNIVGNTTLSLGTNTNRLNTLRSYTSNITQFFVGSTASTSDYSALELDDIGGNFSASLYSQKQSEGIDSLLTLNPTRITAAFNSSQPIFIISSTGETITNNGSNNLFVIDDYINNKGAVYAEDYSSNFTLESLVSRRYVDSLITGSTSGVVQSVGAVGNLSTGGTATNPTINLAASPSFNSITASGASSFTTLSATTMISGSTNLYNIFAPLGQDITTASNGLTKTNNNITLGGTLTADTTIATGSFDFKVSGANASIQTLQYVVGGEDFTVSTSNQGARLIGTDGTSTSTFRANAVSSLFQFNNAGGPQNIEMDGTNMYVRDDINTKGLEYFANYHTNYTNRSLVDREYVTNTIASGSVQSVQAGSNITTGGTSSNPIINLAASPSINNLTISGNTTAQGISGTTIYASQFFQMTPYTGSNPTSPNNNDVWMHSATTGIITLNYRIGGNTVSVELS